MRWTIKTIQFCLCVFTLLGAASGYASVTLKISTSNPSSFEAKEIPLKSYLPKGIQSDDVIDAGGLEVGYDDEREQCYVHKSLTLASKDSVTFEVEIEDIWLIEQGELDALEIAADSLAIELRDTQYAEVVLEIQKNIREKIATIQNQQESALVYKVGPTEHIAAYDANRAMLVVIQGNINDLKRLLSVVNEEKGAEENFDQGQATRLLKAQQVKKQILNYGDPGVEASCLIKEALKVEREPSVFEARETVAMRIEVSNPSATKSRTTPLRYFLAREIDASDIIDPENLNVGFDFEKSLYYVYNDSVALEPGEAKEFAVTLNNKWAINKSKLYGLKVYLESLSRSAEESIGLGAAQEFGKETLVDIYELLRLADPDELTAKYVASYRDNLVKVESVRQAVQRMEDLLIDGNLSPEIEVMKQEILCLDANVKKESPKDIFGMAGVLDALRNNVLAGTIFKGKNLSSVSTWKIIYYIIIFLGVISGVFYFVNIRQQKSTMFDALTGAFTRGYALERFREELKIAKGGENRCSLLVMDIDKFKNINDTHGHSVGDTTLKEFVIAIRKGVRATDLIGRFGGDEFMIILPTLEKDKALKIGEGIARIVEGTAIKINPKLVFNITASIGVATFPDDSATAEDLFDKADQALYQVKKRGGNGAEPFGGNV
jgi:diguanylate cyclase (GGDEF)-like protein